MFRDRKDAGERLAEKLAGYRGQAATLLLALPRGGVPVAATVARVLALPVDVLPVHKIGAPGEPELAVGAVAADGLVVLDEETIATMYISRTALKAVIAEQRKELLRRESLYRGDRAPLKVEGQTVILIDDGLATGYTMLAAVRAVRSLKPAKIVVAVPVAPQETINRLSAEADEVVCVLIPLRLVAVGQFYQDFGQVSDSEVQEILRSGEL